MDAMTVTNWGEFAAGEVIYENDAPGSVEVRVLTAPVYNSFQNAWAFQGETCSGLVEFYGIAGSAYAPRLSRAPQNATIVLLDGTVMDYRTFYSREGSVT
jgi:hypothetical protein